MLQRAENLFNGFFDRYSSLVSCKSSIRDACEALINCYRKGGKVLACGNGGSASDAEHIVGELMNKFRLRRPADAKVLERLRSLDFDKDCRISTLLQQSLPAISLVSQVALITAISNDNGPDMIFAQQVYGYGKAGDVLIALSTSGNSPNVLNAVKVARAIDMITICFTGEKESEMSRISSITIQAPSPTTFMVQELHLPVYHLLCAVVEEEFFGS
jgi:phosphoheptose isomerase